MALATVTASTNSVQVDFEDLNYILCRCKSNRKLCMPKQVLVTVDVITNENLGTGSTYANTDLDGTVLGVGYDKSYEQWFIC
jgi:hypothetical protein